MRGQQQSYDGSEVRRNTKISELYSCPQACLPDYCIECPHSTSCVGRRGPLHGCQNTCLMATRQHLGCSCVTYAAGLCYRSRLGQPPGRGHASGGRHSGWRGLPPPWPKPPSSSTPSCTNTEPIACCRDRGCVCHSNAAHQLKGFTGCQCEPEGW